MRLPRPVIIALLAATLYALGACAPAPPPNATLPPRSNAKPAVAATTPVATPRVEQPGSSIVSDVAGGAAPTTMVFVFALGAVAVFAAMKVCGFIFAGDCCRADPSPDHVLRCHPDSRRNPSN